VGPCLKRRATNESKFNVSTFKQLTANSFPEHTAWGAEVEWTTGWVHIAAFAQVRQELDFVSGRNREISLASGTQLQQLCLVEQLESVS
jgi:hypothetical protein